MKIKHTPWAVCGEGKTRGMVCNSRGMVVAEVRGSSTTDVKANAEVIVCAANNHDKLLEGCRNALIGIQQHLSTDERFKYMQSNLTAAIAKAEGAIETEEKDKPAQCSKCDGSGRRWSDTFGALGDCAACSGTGNIKAEGRKET